MRQVRAPAAGGELQQLGWLNPGPSLFLLLSSRSSSNKNSISFGLTPLTFLSLINRKPEELCWKSYLKTKPH